MTSGPGADSKKQRQWSWLDLSDRRLLLLVATLYANVVLAVMGNLLFASGRIVSMSGSGIDARLASLRAFTAASLNNGEIPLWNPTVFSGIPHLGGFESGLFYPSIVLFQILPLSLAVNVDVAAHLFLMGLLTFIWLRRHVLHPLATAYAGVAAMLAGAYFIQVRSGDLAVLEAFAWTPAALIAMHSLSSGRFAAGVLGGAVALTMPVLCGYPPAVLPIGVAAILYAASLSTFSKARSVLVRGIPVILAAVVLMTAVQVLPGIEVYLQSVRAYGDVYEATAAKALSAPDLAAAAAPWNGVPITAGGAAPLFLGITTLVLAAYGLIFGTGRMRYAATGIAFGLLMLAGLPNVPNMDWLTAKNPVFRFLLEPRLLAIPASLFVTAVACVGLDALIRRPNSARRMAVIAVAFAVLLCAGAVAANASEQPDNDALRAFLTSSGIAICIAALLSLVPIDQRFRYGLIALGVIELYAFAIMNRPSTELNTTLAAPIRTNDTRVLNMDWRNPLPSTGVLSASGNTAMPSRRYMGLLAQTQWSALPEQWRGRFDFVGYHPLLRLLRVGRIVAADSTNENRAIEEALPRLVLIKDYTVAEDREEAFATLNQPTFDPWRMVVLEAEPTPKPRGEYEDAEISVSDESFNGLSLELQLSAPAILLMTDAYNRNWDAFGLPGSSQWQYDVMPANVALRAIPLGAGKHRVRLEYAPLTYRIGRWVSLLAISAMAVFAIVTVRRRRSDAGASPQHPG